MPSKTNKSNKPRGPSKEELEAINRYLTQKPDFDKLIAEAKVKPSPASANKKAETEFDRKTSEAVKEVIETRQKEAQAQQTRGVNMPAGKEDQAGDNIFDKVAKESKDSSASDHPLHQEGGEAATFEHHKANPGPVMSENVGEPASKDDLKKRAEELNKK